MIYFMDVDVFLMVNLAQIEAQVTGEPIAVCWSPNGSAIITRNPPNNEHHIYTAIPKLCGYTVN